MSKKDKKRVDNDVRPEGPWFSNYDYGGPDEATSTSPGRGLYNGSMGKYKSVTEFIDKKRKRRKEIKKAFTIEQLDKAAADFYKQAQEQVVDMSFTDSIRKTYAPLAFKDAEKMLNEKNVSSIPIRIVFNDNKASFLVQSTGADSAEVDSSLTNLFNQKYGPAITKSITKALGGKSQTFNFGLTTVETS